MLLGFRVVLGFRVYGLGLRCGCQPLEPFDAHRRSLSPARPGTQQRSRLEPRLVAVHEARPGPQPELQAIRAWGPPPGEIAPLSLGFFSGSSFLSVSVSG